MRIRHFRESLFIAALSVVLFSCKTTREIPETRLRAMSVSRLLKNVEESAFDYTHFNVRRINIQMDDGVSKNSFRAGLQAVKDQQIQISLIKFNIPLGRIALTTDSVFFVNYLERSFIADDYSALSNLLNFDIDFQIVQAIITGNIFSFFDDEEELEDYQASTDRGMYVIQSEKFRKLRKIEEKGKTQKLERMLKRADEDALIVHTFFFDPEWFVLKQMILEDKTNLRQVDLRFDDYSKVGQKHYPESITVSFQSEEGNYGVDARMSGFSTDRSELSPLKIPDKYQRLYLH